MVTYALCSRLGNAIVKQHVRPTPKSDAAVDDLLIDFAIEGLAIFRLTRLDYMNPVDDASFTLTYCRLAVAGSQRHSC